MLLLSDGNDNECLLVTIDSLSHCIIIGGEKKEKIEIDPFDRRRRRPPVIMRCHS